MATPNAFLANLEKEIALAIQTDADSRTRTQQNGVGAPTTRAQQPYSPDELAELIYYSAQCAAQTFQQDLSRQKNRLNLGAPLPKSTNAPTAASRFPMDSVDLLAQITAVTQFHNWRRSADGNHQTAAPDADRFTQRPSSQVLINQLYREESRSFQVQNQLTQDKLTQQRKQNLQENFSRFFAQLPATAKNQLLAHIPPEIVLQNTRAGQGGILSWITRDTVKVLVLQGLNPALALDAEAIKGLLTERTQAARELNNGGKSIPGQHLQETKKATLNLIEHALSPDHFPDPAQIAAACIEKLGSLLSGFPFPTREIESALAKNAFNKTGQATENNLWARQREQITTQFRQLPATQRAEIETAAGTLQPALASALAAATQESPRQKRVLFHLTSLLSTGQLPLESTLENVNTLLSLRYQLEADKKILQIKVDPRIKQAAQAVFDNANPQEADPSAVAALRRFKLEADELVTKLRHIVASRNNLVFANTDSQFPARLERAVGLTQLHPVLRQGLTETEITKEIISLLKERENPFQTLQPLRIARAVHKSTATQPDDKAHALQEAALQTEKSNTPEIFHNRLQQTVRSAIREPDKTKARETLKQIAEMLRYLPLQPPLDPQAVENTANKIVTEILRSAKSRHDNDLETQFTNPSPADMRVIIYQAHKEVERKLSDKIARTVRRNAESLEQQTLAIAECFQSPAELAKAWTRKENAEATLDELRQTKASQLITQIQTLETALAITEQAKELKTIEAFRAWITDTHNRALEAAQAQYEHDPFNIVLRTRVQELNEFKAQLATARSAAIDPAGNLDIRVIWDILAQNKTNIQRQIHQLQNEHRELQRTTRGIEDPESLLAVNGSDHNGKAQSQSAPIGINSLARAFDNAFAAAFASHSPNPEEQQQSANPFQGHPLEIILEAGNRQLQLRAKTNELNQYWIQLIGNNHRTSTTDPRDPGTEIDACAKLLLFHEIAKSESKPALPSEFNQMWLNRQHTYPKTAQDKIESQITSRIPAL